VRIRIDSAFEQQRQAFRFVFACEHCVYFDAAAIRCAHGYPTDEHRSSAFASEGPRTGMFCKEFEIA
jgi:hypothetical protein